MTTPGRKPKALSSLIERERPCLPVMPLMHTTDALSFEGVTATRNLETKECEFYKEPLLYFFYGRPAYRPNFKIQPTSLSLFRPVSIILKPHAVNSISRVVPLDTGALHRGLYVRQLAGMVRPEAFEIEGGLLGAARLVRAVFGSNKDYYLGRPQPAPSRIASNPIAEAFFSIISDSGQSEVDDRRSTIEIQSSQNMRLDSNNVEAIAIPEVFLDDSNLRNILLSEWQCKIIRYDIYHDRPASDVREILARVKDYLDREGYFCAY